MVRLSWPANDKERGMDLPLVLEKGRIGEVEKRDLERAERSRDQTRRPKGIFSTERRDNERRSRWRTGNNVVELNKCNSDKGLIPRDID
ncbi:hypothetical protein TNIN_319351 [Trichonephila inaurata madagascariensis]|uniref:Uncharacterized protein n=1 Tax=Trichonephila inaurata madagascariensis TaxID=2747483 RepID=A0A8X6WPY7_9ARAC|nr:hypothetical protein TNIN_319351 [Trichonephila inaurata madagascariensis]